MYKSVPKITEKHTRSPYIVHEQYTCTRHTVHLNDVLRARLVVQSVNVLSDNSDISTLISQPLLQVSHSLVTSVGLLIENQLIHMLYMYT